MAERLRVALVAHDVGGVGGMERVLEELVRAGHGEVELHVVASRLAPELRALVTWHPVTVPRRPFPLKFLAFAARASLVLRRLEVDVVHVTGALVPSRADLSTVHFCHAAYVASTGHLAARDVGLARRANTTISRLLALAFERWCYRPRRLRLAAAVSDRVAAEMRASFPGVPVVVTPNGVDLGRFVPGHPQRDAVRGSHGVDPGTTVLLFVGGDWARKGLWPLVDAVGDLVTSGRDVRLWVVGRGDEGRLGGAAAAAAIGDRVEAFGVRADVEVLMGAADVFVLPSQYETYPLVAWEAAACGLPQVVTRTGAVESLIEATGCGVLVSGRDLRGELVAALGALVDDAEARRAMGARGVAAVADFDWARTSAATVRLYRQLAGAAGSGRIGSACAVEDATSRPGEAPNQATLEDREP